MNCAAWPASCNASAASSSLPTPWYTSADLSAPSLSLFLSLSLSLPFPFSLSLLPTTPRSRLSIWLLHGLPLSTCSPRRPSCPLRLTFSAPVFVYLVRAVARVGLRQALVFESCRGGPLASCVVTCVPYKTPRSSMCWCLTPYLRAQVSGRPAAREPRRLQPRCSLAAPKGGEVEGWRICELGTRMETEGGIMGLHHSKHVCVT